MQKLVGSSMKELHHSSTHFLKITYISHKYCKCYCSLNEWDRMNEHIGYTSRKCTYFPRPVHAQEPHGIIARFPLLLHSGFQFCSIRKNKRCLFLSSESSSQRQMWDTSERFRVFCWGCLRWDGDAWAFFGLVFYFFLMEQGGLVQVCVYVCSLVVWFTLDQKTLSVWSVPACLLNLTGALLLLWHHCWLFLSLLICLLLFVLLFFCHRLKKKSQINFVEAQAKDFPFTR